MCINTPSWDYMHHYTKFKKIRVYVSCTCTVHLTATYSIIYSTDSFSQNIQANSAPLLIWTQYKIALSAVNLSCALVCLISVTVFNLTHLPLPQPASDNLRLQIACTRLSTVCSPVFSHHDLQWNNHPLPVSKKPSLDSFKSNLKTFLIPKQIDPHHTFSPLKLLSSSTCSLTAVCMCAFRMFFPDKILHL